MTNGASSRISDAGDREGGGEGKRGDLGGRRIIKKTKRGNRRWNCDWSSDVCSSDLRSRSLNDRGGRADDDERGFVPDLRCGGSGGGRGGEEGRSRGAPDH